MEALVSFVVGVFYLLLPDHHEATVLYDMLSLRLATWQLPFFKMEPSDWTSLTQTRLRNFCCEVTHLLLG